MATRRILVGLDGSHESRSALRTAIELAEALGGELIVVHALGLLAEVEPGVHVATASHRDEVAAAFDDWCAPVSETLLDVRRLSRDGPPVDVLLDVAETEEVDYVVVGTRGAGGAGPAALGSTSHQLAARCDRPVVIVPHPGRA